MDRVLCTPPRTSRSVTRRSLSDDNRHRSRSPMRQSPQNDVSYCVEPSEGRRVMMRESQTSPVIAVRHVPSGQQHGVLPGSSRELPGSYRHRSGSRREERPGSQHNQSRSRREERPGSQRDQSRSRPEEQPGSQRDLSRSRREEQPGSQRDRSRSRREERPGSQRDRPRSRREEQPGSHRDRSRSRREERPGSQRDRPRSRREERQGSQRDRSRSRREERPGSQRDRPRSRREERPGSQRDRSRSRREERLGSQRDRSCSSHEKRPSRRRGRSRSRREERPGSQRDRSRGHREERPSRRHEQSRSSREQRLGSHRGRSHSSHEKRPSRRRDRSRSSREGRPSRRHDRSRSPHKERRSNHRERKDTTDKYLKTCDRNSPEVNECLTEAIQEGLQVMTGGIKELGVPAVDPYHQKELRVEYKRNQILVKMIMKDIFVEGLKAAKIHDVRLRADDDSFLMEVDVTAPVVFVQGRYYGEGSYNSLQILATGGFNTTMTDLTYTWKLGGTPERINNETYVRINSFYMRPDVGNLKSYLSNDNPDTQEFITLGNNFANANWKVLYRELLPYAQANWNKIGIRVANKIFLKIPYDQLFPAKL